MASSWRGWVSGHPLLAFTLITYAVTWSTWAGVVRLGGDLWELAGLAGLFAPAWAALLVMRASDDAPRTRRGLGGWLAAAAVWLFSTGAFTAYVAVTSGPPQPVAVVIYAGIALLPTGVAASVGSTSTRVRSMVSSLPHPGAPSAGKRRRCCCLRLSSWPVSTSPD
jgi:hypothetical protein